MLTIEYLQQFLPGGVELYLFAPHGVCHILTRGSLRSLNPIKNAFDRIAFLRFIDDGQFVFYFIGDALTSDLKPANATYKLGIVRPHSAFIPHAHGTEHFVLSLGYASCSLYDMSDDRVVDVRLFPGTMLHIPAMMPHSFNNRATDPLLILPANTGIGIDSPDYAITASMAKERAYKATEAISTYTNIFDNHETIGCQQAEVDYIQLAHALERLEQTMPKSEIHASLTWREKVAAHLRKIAWKLEIH